MWHERIVDERELDAYLVPCLDRSLPFRLKALYEHQRRVWPEFQRGHEAMEKAETRTLQLDDAWIFCRFTPHRLTSVSARVDAASVLKRPCFLCHENLYPLEKGFLFADDYLVLCNIAPIFNLHVVIVHRQHIAQQVEPHFMTMLELTRKISPDFVVIYNGPRCGASAPDHLHFQALPCENLPLTCQIWGGRAAASHGMVIQREEILISAPQGFGRHFLNLQSGDPVALDFWLREVLASLRETEHTTLEPMINLVMVYRDGLWNMILFPRRRHRPTCYQGDGDDQLLISPGAIDMAGVFVIPRRSDFQKVNAKVLAGIYQEVTLGEDRLLHLMQSLRTKARDCLTSS